MEQLTDFMEDTILYSEDSTNDVLSNFPTLALAQLTEKTTSQYGHVNVYKSKGIKNAYRHLESRVAYFYDAPRPREPMQRPGVTRYDITGTVINTANIPLPNIRNVQTYIEPMDYLASSANYYAEFALVNESDLVPLCSYTVDVWSLREYVKSFDDVAIIGTSRIMSMDREDSIVRKYMPTIDWIQVSS